MSIPKTTEFTLKRILENLDRIPPKGFSPEAPKLTTEQKRQLKEMTGMFSEYGKVFENDQQIMDAARAISEVMKLAETYAVNECGDWFQTEIVKKNFQEASKKTIEFQKLAQECYTRMQQLGVLYEDLSHVLGRYYKLQENTPCDNPTDIPDDPRSVIRQPDPDISNYMGDGDRS
jgi:hypothetical protein